MITNLIRLTIGNSGFVIGIDLQTVKPFEYDNVVAIKGDFTLEENLNKIRELIPNDEKKVDVVISDASPNISGYWDIDLSLIHISEPTRRRDSSRMPSSA